MNFIPNASSRGPLDGLLRLPIFMLRVLLGLIGLVFTLGLLAVGVVAASALVGWALLRGRRPQGLRFDMRQGRMAEVLNRRRTAARGEVVDIEAREVVDTRAGPAPIHPTQPGA